MKKNCWLMLFASAVLLLGCRTESFNQEESQNPEQASNSTLKVSLQEVLSKTSKYDEELTHDISTFTWKHKAENKNTGKTTEDNEYYFNTDDIQKITAENATYYTIPAISKTDEGDDILHSLSIRVSGDGLESRMITLQLKDDGNHEIVSSVPYSFDPQSVMAREDVECTTYLVSGPCSCHTVHEAGGCAHPIQIMITQCGTASGAGAYGSGSTYYTGNPTSPFSGNTSGVYVYGTADQVYNKLRIQLKPDYILTDIQKFKIMELPNLASQIIAFLTENPQHKAAAISFINSIGPISTAQEMQTAINNYINTFNFKTGLSAAQSNWIAQNPALFDNILAYILQDYPNRKDFGYFGIDFFTQNSDTTWEQFENWFMMESEGKDFYYDENFWEDPNLTFPIQALPSWNAFSSAYPNQTSAQMYGVVGGAVAQAQIDYPIETQNGCALKVSRALNYSGVVIPNIPGKTLKGADNKNYFLNAKALNAWMRKTFGTSPQNPHHKNFTKLDGGNNGKNFPNLLKNKKGIFSLVSPTNSQWASGHADILYLNGTCKAGCHFFDGDILYIDFWELN